MTDHIMPQMTGADLARAAKKLRPRLHVLVVSGYSDATGLAADLPRLEKPFRQAELASHLEAVMSPRSSATSVH
ncbi:hypothetical protein Q5H94_10035 [Sphingomonas sp. CA1-15]|uniref:Response regulatory domain-containing protein n=1 Tax=Sphingomonas immobilis TaxID=3063997 RepID=A0ABT8ZYL3_9SPHN|nr:hypothetical protein [Sphingomonas sp. CA1-15]